MRELHCRYLTTKELPKFTGLSASFFEKGRVYGYGPPYRKVGAKVIYRLADVESWLDTLQRDPRSLAHD